MRINENQKVTLTLGQLRRLVKEAVINESKVYPELDPDERARIFGEFIKQLPGEGYTISGYEQWLNDNGYDATGDLDTRKFIDLVDDDNDRWLDSEGVSDDEEEKQDQYFKVQCDGSDCAIIVWDADSNKFRAAQMDDDLDSNTKDDIRSVRNISYFYDTTPNALLDILDHHLGSLGYDICPMSTENALARLED